MKKDVKKMTILIPAYEPDMRLIYLIMTLQKIRLFKIVIVDDGSGNMYRKIFDVAQNLGCTVLRHSFNRGKGEALKTGFRFLQECAETEGVVCADSDGQHLPEDIMKVAKAVSTHPNSIILGSREFAGTVPLRSRFGNTVTRMIFSSSTGTHLRDTQTGLRGYSAEMFDWLCQVKGSRFEYEMNILLEAKKAGYFFFEIIIHTVYDQKKHSSHFRTFSDSAKVYRPIVKFCTSSLLSGLIDFILLMFLEFWSGNLLFAVVGARICSALFNYSMNKYLVFSGSRELQIKKTISKYFVLAGVVMVLNYTIMYVFFVGLGLPLFSSKMITEGIVFSLSYWAQRKYVFSQTGH
jgi:glycosyltransferase involved in cell wall biosynthesis